LDGRGVLELIDARPDFQVILFGKNILVIPKKQYYSTPRRGLESLVNTGYRGDEREHSTHTLQRHCLRRARRLPWDLTGA
jgi:hypothetical protein